MFSADFLLCKNKLKLNFSYKEKDMFRFYNLYLFILASGFNLFLRKFVIIVSQFDMLRTLLKKRHAIDYTAEVYYAVVNDHAHLLKSATHIDI